VRKNGTTAHVTGLERFGLDDASFRRLKNRNMVGYAYLRTYDLTAAVQKLPPLKRQQFMAARANRWIDPVQSRYPGLSFQIQGGKQPARNNRRWSELPTTLKVKGPARKILTLANSAGVRSIHVTRIAGHRRHCLPKTELEWYCVRAFVVIQVERAESGLQNTENRFMLVRASSFEDAKKRLQRQWREYATPYLNSEGR
jgi:hypothetical protein